MTCRAISLLALVTALCVGCNGRSAQSASDAAGTTEPSSGAERGLPEVATYAQRLDDPSRDAWQKPDEVVALLDCQPGATIVDLGAGTGYFLPFLSKAVGERGQVLALDIAAETVTWLRDRAEEQSLYNVEGRTVAPDDPGLERRSADRILVVNTWHHIDAREAYAGKLRSALARGGRLLIVDFTLDAPMGPPVGKRLKVDTVIQELEAAGFETQVLEETLPYQYVVSGQPR
jgi:predicted methyltransferase